MRRDRSGRALASLPAPLQEVIRLVFVALRVTHGPRSFLTYLRLRSVRRHQGSSGRVVRMRLRPLGGREVLLRRSTSDVDTVWGTFAGRYHLPPPEAGEPRVIWDLGANVGLTMADLAERHPGARVLGVEVDAENAALARANVTSWGARCEVIEAAIWPRDGHVRYVRLTGATSGHYLTPAALEDDPAVTAATSVSPDSLLARSGPDATVDYAKIDIEGAEATLLREATGWAERVRTIKVEVHPPYSVEACEHDLRALGFETRLDQRQRTAVIGVRAD